MYLTQLKTSIIAASCICFFAVISDTKAELMVPMNAADVPATEQSGERKLGGSIAKIDENGLEINAVYYPFSSSGVKIHGMNGKLAKVTDLQLGMLVSFSIATNSQSTKISEIWVLKNE